MTQKMGGTNSIAVNERKAARLVTMDAEAVDFRNFISSYPTEVEVGNPTNRFRIPASYAHSRE